MDGWQYIYNFRLFCHVPFSGAFHLSWPLHQKILTANHALRSPTGYTYSAKQEVPDAMAIQHRVGCMLYLALLSQPLRTLNFAKPASIKSKFQPGREDRDLYVKLELGAADESESVEGLSRKDRNLINSMVTGGNNRDWFTVLGAFGACSRTIAPQFNFAMAAALKCGQFKKGIAIFDELSASGVRKTLKSYCCAIRLSGELGSRDRIMALWMEAQQDELWESDEQALSLMCAALYASSKVGNVTFAATLLDLMQKRGKPLNVIDWNQGIDACAVAGEAGAASFLFDNMIKAGVKPNIISFALLVGAHSGKPVARISEAARRLNDHDILPDSAFFEELVCAIFGARQLKMNTMIRAEDTIAVVRDASVSRRAEAWRVIQEAKAKGLHLSSLVQLFEASLQKVAEFPTI